MLPAVAFVLYIFYAPGLSDAAILPRWAVLSVLVPIAVLFARGRQVDTHVTVLFLLALAGALLTTLHAPDVFDALNGVWWVCLAGGVFYLGWCEESLDGVLVAAGAALWVSAAIAVVQLVAATLHGMASGNGLTEALLHGDMGSGQVMSVHRWMGWAWVPAAGTPAVGGLFFNKNFLAEAALPVLVGLTYQRRHILSIGALICVVLPLSREAAFAAGLTWLVYLLSTRRWHALAASAGAFMVLGALDASLPHRLDSLHYRFTDWQVAYQHLDWVGWGVGSYAVLAPELGHVHNEFLELAFDLGVGALPLLAVIFLSLRGPDVLGRLVLVSVLGECCLAFPLHLPATVFFAAVAAGNLSRGWSLLRDRCTDRAILATADPHASY